MEAALILFMLLGMYGVGAKMRRERREEIAAAVDGPSAQVLIRLANRELWESGLPKDFVVAVPKEDTRFLRHHMKPPPKWFN